MNDCPATVSGQTIDELHRDAGRWIAVETMLFEVLGGWARSGDRMSAARRRAYATWCHRHAWHAELWRTRLPVIPHHPFAVDDGLGFVTSSRALIEADPATLVPTVLTGLRDHLGRHRADVDARLDGPTTRILDLVAADLDAEIAELA